MDPVPTFTSLADVYGLDGTSDFDSISEASVLISCFAAPAVRVETLTSAFTETYGAPPDILARAPGSSTGLAGNPAILAENAGAQDA